MKSENIFLALYGEPLFWQLPMTFMALSLVGFMASALPFTWLAWADPVWARRWKIQSGSLKPEIARLWKPTLRNFARNQLVLLVLAVVLWPLLRLAVDARDFTQAPAPAVWLFVLQLLAVILIDDFIYYWFHRLMHTRRLLKMSHHLHHRPRHVFALQGNYMTWWEFALTSFLVVLTPILLGVHYYVICTWVFLRQVEAAQAHAGYQLPGNPRHWIPGAAGEAYHDFHHSRYTGNYAVYTELWDRVFGTFSRDYPQFMRQWRANGNGNKKIDVNCQYDGANRK